MIVADADVTIRQRTASKAEMPWASTGSKDVACSISAIFLFWDDCCCFRVCLAIVVVVVAVVVNSRKRLVYLGHVK